MAGLGLMLAVAAVLGFVGLTLGLFFMVYGWRAGIRRRQILEWHRFAEAVRLTPPMVGFGHD